MKKFFLTGLAALFFFAAASVSFAENYQKNWRLAWSDEFDYAGKPSAEKWSYDVGCNGWGNGELQCYTKDREENARVENGKLIIEARRDGSGKWPYTSARIKTKDKAQWTYGRIEVSAKLPSGRGVWPAIWMLPCKWVYGKYQDGFWPDNGEIDIMEAVGYDPGTVYATVHTAKHSAKAGDPRRGKAKVPDAADAFHVYAAEWYPDRIDFFVDNEKYFTFFKQRDNWRFWPFNVDFYLVVNLAVGGSWGGKRGVDDNILPQRFEIDYVRVYQ